jgi:phenylpropionate dioxygenase-like ring-hydroxylating dioxygenase large terminal subunit
MNAPAATPIAPPSAGIPAVLPSEQTFDPVDRAILARHWYPVARVEDVADKPLSVRLLDQRLVVYRSGDEVVVASEFCPHRGVPLGLGTMVDGAVQCPYHGLRFGAGGACVHIPAHADRAIPPQFNLRTYPAVQRYGLVWTCLDPSADNALPEMPHWDEPDFQQIVCPPVEIGGFAGRQVEGFLDVAHFAFIHTATFADPLNAGVPAYRPARTGYGFEAEYWSTVGNYPASATHKGPDGFRWLRHFRCTPPFTATLEIHFPGEARLVIMNAASPVSARQTRMFAPIARNFDTHIPVADVHAFNATVFEEDRMVVETQQPSLLPLDPAAEAHLPADMSSMLYRRLLREMGLAFANPA